MDISLAQVAVLAAILFGEEIGAYGVVDLVTGVLGLILLEVPPNVLSGVSLEDVDKLVHSVDWNKVWNSGEWWMLLAAQSMAIGTIMVRWVCRYSDSIMATGWIQHMVLGDLPLLVISGMQHDLGNLHNLDSTDVSIFGIAIRYGVFFYNATKSLDSFNFPQMCFGLRFIDAVHFLFSCMGAWHFLCSWGFKLSESENGESLLLDVPVGRFLETFLIDVDVLPTLICVLSKVSVDNCSAQRSTTTGNLLIRMPKVKVNQGCVYQKSSCKKPKVVTNKEMSTSLASDSLDFANHDPETPKVNAVKRPSIDQLDLEYSDMAHNWIWNIRTWTCHLWRRLERSRSQVPSFTGISNCLCQHTSTNNELSAFLHGVQGAMRMRYKVEGMTGYPIIMLIDKSINTIS